MRNSGASQVSRATQTLDEELEAWRNSHLGEVVYLHLDARYERVGKRVGKWVLSEMRLFVDGQ